MEDGEALVGILDDLDACLDEVAPVLVLGDLQGEALVADAVVVLHLAALLDAKDVVEGASDVRQEGRALLGGLDHELGIEGGQEALCDEAVGLFDGGDGGQAQLLGQALLQDGEGARDRLLVSGVKPASEFFADLSEMSDA